MRNNFLKASAFVALLLFLVAGCGNNSSSTKPSTTTTTTTTTSTTTTSSTDTGHTHSWSTTYEHDETNHWQTCSGCDETNNLGAHTYTETITTPATHLADGVKTYTCNVCGYSYTEAISKTTEHTATGDYLHDETNHWKLCSCGEKVGETAHTFTETITTPATHLSNGVKTYTCNVCGYSYTESISKTTEHTATGDYLHNATNHWKLCACGEKVGEEAHNLFFHYDESGHWKDCVCGYETEKENHSFTETILTPATYDAPGEKKLECVCGYQKTEAIAQLVVPDEGVLNHEISVSAALTLLETNLTEANAVTTAEYYVVGIIASTAKADTSDDQWIHIQDENDPTKIIESVYAVNADNIDVNLFKAGNRVYVKGAVTFYNGTTYEFTNTGSVYKLESVSYAVTVAEGLEATVGGLEETYAAGSTVNFTVTPNANYQILEVTVNGEAVTPNEEVYSFVISKASTISCSTRIIPATTDLEIYDLEGKVAADLADDWTAKKYDGGWIDTSASMAISVDYNRDAALQFKYWDNYSVFRYSVNYTANNAYQGLAFDIAGNGVSTLKVQLMNSTSGVYMTYNLGALDAVWDHYELAFDDDNWKINFANADYTFAQLKAGGYIDLYDASELATYFNMVNFIFYGETSGSNSANAFMSNLVFKATCAASSKEAIELTLANTVLDFEEGTTGSSYSSANWKTRYYGNSGWTEYGATSQMNSRTKNDSKNVNMYCQTTTYQFKYEPSEPIGYAQYVSLKLGNYYSGGASISVKVSVVTAMGQTIYVLGDANNFFVIANDTSSSYETYTKTFSPADIVYLVITTKTTSGTSYLYMDDVKILAEAPSVSYSALNINENLDGYSSLPSSITQGASNIYFKTDNAGDGGSKCYLSVYTYGSNTATYTLAEAGLASELTFAVKNTHSSAVEEHVKAEVFDDGNNLVATEQFVVAAGAAWDTKTVTFATPNSVVAKVVFTFYPQGATGDTYCYLDTIVIH